MASEDNVAVEGAPPAKKGEGWYTWYSIIIIACVSFVSNVDRGIINLLIEPIKHDFGLTDTSVSLLAGFAFSFSYFLFALPMGRVTDGHNRKYILTTALTVWSIASAACGLAQQFWQLFAARSVVGAGESVKGPCSMSMISDMVSRVHLPRAYAIYQMGIVSGMSGSMILGGFLLKVFEHVEPLNLGFGLVIKDWHLVFLVASTPGLLLAVLMALTIREPKRRGRAHVSKKQVQVPIREVAQYLGRNWRVYVPLLLGIAASAIRSLGMSVWWPTLFTRTYDLDLAMAGAIVGLMILIPTPISLTVGAILAEWLTRRGHHDAMLRACLYAFTLSVPFSIIAPLMPTWWLCFGTGIIASIMGGMAMPAQNSSFQLITPNEMRGQINAIYLVAISVIGGGVGPTAVALMTDYIFGSSDMLRYSMSLFIAIFGPLSILCIWLAMKPFGKLAHESAEKERAEQAASQ